MPTELFRLHVPMEHERVLFPVDGCDKQEVDNVEVSESESIEIFSEMTDGGEVEMTGGAVGISWKSRTFIMFIILNDNLTKIRQKYLQLL